MDLINIQVSPREYFQLGKFKISEGIKCLKDFVERCNSKLEMAGMVDEIMNCVQSLRRDLQHIESSVQRGQPDMSSNLNGMDLHHGQEITRQNTYFGPTQNQESEMVVNSSVESLSGTKKRKLKSKVWKDFTKYVGEDKKEWAKCKHCARKFVGSSKSGTTHLKNHLQSCPSFKNPNVVVDKVKEKREIGSDLDGSNWVRKMIKYGLNNIKDDIFVVYREENYKLREYFDKLSYPFSMTIEWLDNDYWYIRIHFVDDSWELRNKIIYFGDGDDVCEIVKSVLMDWKIDRKIFFVRIYDEVFEKDDENLKNWLNKRGSLSFIRTFDPYSILFNNIQRIFSFHGLKEISPNKILKKALDLWGYISTSSNNLKFRLAVEQALYMGNTVTSQSVPLTCDENEGLLEWVVGCKEVFSELEYIDPHFQSTNFTNEDWDDATLLYSSWQVIKDLKKVLDTEYETANVYFSMVCNFFLRWDQLRKSDNFYLRTIASYCQEYVVKCWKDSGLVFEISLILDPRSKMEMVECYCKMIYGNDAEAHLSKTKDDVTNIYNEYVKGTSSSSSSRGYSSTSESELNCYLRDKKHPQDEGFDILQWWHDKSPIYPILARMAHDFLSISVKSLNTDYSVLEEIVEILSSATLDDDLRCKLACTKIWLNTPENN